MTGDKLRFDYFSRRESGCTLPNAQKRIAGDKGNVSGAEQVAANVAKLLLEADQLAAAGICLEARAKADKANLLAKASVGQLRSGDPLVGALNFANKDEENKCAYVRTGFIKTLFKVLVEPKDAVNPLVPNLLSEGMKLRTQTDKAALKDDQGIGVLEDSTAQYVRAIRSAEIYIPG